MEGTHHYNKGFGKEYIYVHTQSVHPKTPKGKIVVKYYSLLSLQHFISPLLPLDVHTCT